MYKLEEKSTIASDLKELVDCAAGVTSAISSCLSSSKSAERQFGGNNNKRCMAREERRSSVSKIDTHSEFDSRSAQTMSVNEVANQIEPTPHVLPHLFRLHGQTGHL